MNSLKETVKSYNEKTSNFISISFVAAYISLVFGICAPVLSIRKEILWIELNNDTYSLLEGIIDLFKNGHVILSTIIFSFSILFPIGKIVTLNYLWNKKIADKNRQTVLNIIEIFSKWSMLDVFVISLIIVIANVSAMTDAKAKWGIYIFITHVIISMTLSLLIVRINKRINIMKLNI